MKKITKGDVLDIPFPRISVVEQNRIASDFDRIKSFVDNAKRLRGEATLELEALFPALLHKAFGEGW